VLAVELAKVGYNVTGVDAAPKMLAAAFRLSQLEGIQERVRYELVATDCVGEFESKRYDVVVSLGVLEYLDEWRSCLLRLSERVRSDGSLILSFPNRLSILRLIERCVYKNVKFMTKVGLMGRTVGRGDYLIHQLHWFDLKELAEILDARGLVLRRSMFHVAPTILGKTQRMERIGMSCIAEFVRR
jgi:SAM-dependent methyltransferase